MRLRDLGIVVVIDFIDMEDARNQRAIELRMKDALNRARADGEDRPLGLMVFSARDSARRFSQATSITCPALQRPWRHP